MLECHVIEPLREHVRTVIWFHGMGESPAQYVKIIEDLDLPGRGIRSVLPYATERRHAWSGKLISAWFMRMKGEIFKEDPVSLNAAIDQVHQLIRHETGRIDTSSIALGGFSQGAALAINAGLRYEQPLRGIVLFAPTPLNKSELLATRSAAAASTPCWLGHGADDDVVPALESAALTSWLELQGHPVRYHLCDCAHEPFSGMDATALADLRWIVEGQSQAYRAVS